jgi:hypothetical protein
MQVIAISGKAAAGKDTFAAMVQNKIPNVGIIPFAEELKKIACQLWDVTEADMATYDGKARMRDKLIALGCAVREISQDTWVNLVIKKIKQSKFDTVMIPDLRFVNEIYKLLIEFGSDVRLVRVSASRGIRLARMGGERAADYVDLDFEIDKSETELDFLEISKVERPTGAFTIVNNYNNMPEFTEIIENSFNSLADLERQVDLWLEEPAKTFSPEIVQSKLFNKLIF